MQDVETTTYNQFSKVYQIQLYTDRIKELITKRNLERLRSMMRVEAGEREKLEQEEAIVREEQKKMQIELDRHLLSQQDGGEERADTLHRLERELERIA